ncbi:Myotubularin-Related Protein 3 [Manis pentadactyla]|nr:Myotubularin-Related Protein 3 [Manis pentadactyla]
MLLLSPTKFGSFVVEAEKEKGEGYTAVEICGVGLGILAQLDGKLESLQGRSPALQWPSNLAPRDQQLRVTRSSQEAQSGAPHLVELRDLPGTATCAK